MAKRQKTILTKAVSTYNYYAPLFYFLASALIVAYIISLYFTLAARANAAESRLYDLIKTMTDNDVTCQRTVKENADLRLRIVSLDAQRTFDLKQLSRCSASLGKCSAKSSKKNRK